MKEEKKTAKKKAAKKSTKKLESILDLNANNIWDLDEFAISEAWERERAEEDFSISEAKLLNTIRLAFEVVHYNPEDERAVEKYEKLSASQTSAMRTFATSLHPCFLSL